VRRLIGLAPLLIAAAPASPPANPPVVVDRARAVDTSPLLLSSIDDLRVVCGDRKDTAQQLICVSWLNGASQINARFRSLSPQLLPDFCAPPEGLPLGRQRDVLLAWLAENPKERLDPALAGYRKALSAAFPCKAGAG
jgi:Rap1a immunity proteins